MTSTAVASADVTLIQKLIGAVQVVPEVCRIRDLRNFPIHLHVHIHVQLLVLRLPLLLRLPLQLLRCGRHGHWTRVHFQLKIGVVDWDLQTRKITLNKH